MDKSGEEVFAKGYCFYKIFWIFVFGCLLGTYYEQILNFCKVGVWESRSGVVIGPFNPVYGGGLAFCVAFLGKKKRRWYETLIYGGLIGGFTEYMLNLLQEIFINSRSWNYEGKFLSLNGRTTIPFAFFWGLCALGIITFIYPFLSKIIEKIPLKIGKIVSNIMVIFLALDMALTGAALIRQAQRREGVVASNFIEEFFDYCFNDSYLDKVFPNMKVNEEAIKNEDR